MEPTDAEPITSFTGIPRHERACGQHKFQQASSFDQQTDAHHHALQLPVPLVQ
jgi:hypothetical protein